MQLRTLTRPFQRVSQVAFAIVLGFCTRTFLSLPSKRRPPTTYEIGSRGRRPDYTWDVALYHADIQNELMCFFSSFGNCNVTNADRTIHHGLEAAVGVTLLKTPDRIWLNVAYTEQLSL